MKPARPAKALAKLAVRKCTRADKPRLATMPSPCSPCVPSECDSSTINMQPCSLAAATTSASGQTLPLVL